MKKVASKTLTDENARLQMVTFWTKLPALFHRPDVMISASFLNFLDFWKLFNDEIVTNSLIQHNNLHKKVEKLNYNKGAEVTRSA